LARPPLCYHHFSNVYFLFNILYYRNMNDALSDLIHDLKNHLTALYGQVYMLRSTTKNNANQQQIELILEKMESRLKSVEEIANQIGTKQIVKSEL